MRKFFIETGLRGNNPYIANALLLEQMHISFSIWQHGVKGAQVHLKPRTKTLSQVHSQV